MTEKGRRKAGSNLEDVALVLWSEMREIDDPRVRRGLLERVAGRLAAMYAGKIQGQTLKERMESVAEVFAERQVPLRVDAAGRLPVLTVEACPYPGLVNGDRAACVLEQMLFSKLLQQDVQLSGCRMDGDPGCMFQVEAPTG